MKVKESMPDFEKARKKEAGEVRPTSEKGPEKPDENEPGPEKRELVTRATEALKGFIKREHNEAVVKIRLRVAELRAFKEKNAAGLSAVAQAVNGNVIRSRYADRFGSKPEGKVIGTIKNKTLALVRDQQITDAEQGIAILDRVIGEHPPQQ